MENKKIIFRRASIIDAPLIAEFGRQTFATSFGADNTAEDMEKYLSANFSIDHIQNQLSDQASTFILAFEQGKPVGYAMLYAGQAPPPVTGPRPVELVRIYVDTAIISKGYGSMVMRTCLEEARQGGFETIWLGVWEKNQRAIRFYEKWGFQQVGTIAFLLGDDLQTDFVMARRLDII